MIDVALYGPGLAGNSLKFVPGFLQVSKLTSHLQETTNFVNKNAGFLCTEIQKDSNFCLKNAFGSELKI